MRIALKLLALGGVALTLSACGHNTEQRAATGAGAGLIVAGPVGAAVGAGVGVAVSKARGRWARSPRRPGGGDCLKYERPPAYGVRPAHRAGAPVRPASVDLAAQSGRALFWKARCAHPEPRSGA